MKSLKEEIIKYIPNSLLTSYRDFRNNQFEKKNYNSWLQQNCPIPTPEFYKRKRIQEIQKKSNISTLIETGTFLGDMIYFNRKKFKKIISIELSEELFQRAVLRFKEVKNIKLLLGDSGTVLPEILKSIDGPVIFWLDGHYSSEFKGVQTAKGEKECPILEELEPILKSRFNHIILIDDARMFEGINDYPTESELFEFIKKHRSQFSFERKNDIFEIML